MRVHMWYMNTSVREHACMIAYGGHGRINIVRGSGRLHRPVALILCVWGSALSSSPVEQGRAGHGQAGLSQD